MASFELMLDNLPHNIILDFDYDIFNWDNSMVHIFTVVSGLTGACVFSARITLTGYTRIY